MLLYKKIVAHDFRYDPRIKLQHKMCHVFHVIIAMYNKTDHVRVTQE